MIVTVLLVAVLALVIGFGVALAVRARSEFREQNEVVPGVPSPAPESWAGAHTPEARLHRRLRDSVAAAHTASGGSPAALDATVTRIDSEAVALDDQLVAAAALPEPHREAAVARIEPLVEALESTVAALVEQVATAGRPPELMERALDDTDIALQALELARAEVERLDHQPPDTPSA